MYGGFKCGGCDFVDRSPAKYRTVLTGLPQYENLRNEVVVMMGDDTRLDGFTVTQAAIYGIYGSGVNFAIENCTIEKNWAYGLRASNGDVVLKWCTLRDNISDGVFHQGEDFVLHVENCWMRQSGERGIHCINSTPVILNSIVSESDMNEFGNEGIRVVNPTYPPVLYNNTIAHNRSKGLFFADSGTVTDPNAKDWPHVDNCILWLNNAGGNQFSGFGASALPLAASTIRTILKV